MYSITPKAPIEKALSGHYLPGAAKFIYRHLAKNAKPKGYCTIRKSLAVLALNMAYTKEKTLSGLINLKAAGLITELSVIGDAIEFVVLIPQLKYE